MKAKTSSKIRNSRKEVAKVFTFTNAIFAVKVVTNYYSSTMAGTTATATNALFSCFNQSHWSWNWNVYIKLKRPDILWKLYNRNLCAYCFIVVVITTVKLHSRKPKLRSCTVSNPTRSVSEACYYGNHVLWSLLEIRLTLEVPTPQILLQQPANYLSVLGHFTGLALKGLIALAS